MSDWEELRAEIEAMHTEAATGIGSRNYRIPVVEKAAVLAAIDRAALSGSTAPLDVERLARAIEAMYEAIAKGLIYAEWYKTPEKVAAVLAAEYARLASPDPAP